MIGGRRLLIDERVQTPEYGASCIGPSYRCTGTGFLMDLYVRDEPVVSACHLCRPYLVLIGGIETPEVIERLLTHLAVREAD